jgi:hypothetical protein
LRDVRKAQKISGNVDGSSSVSGFTTTEGQTFNALPFGDGSSDGSGKIDFNSGASGFVKTSKGGAIGSGASGISGTSTQTIKGTTQPAGLDGAYGVLSSSGSSVNSAASDFDASFSPPGSSGATEGRGSSTGSLVVVGAVVADNNPGQQIVGAITGGGTAEIFAGASATGYNELASAGGRGSGSAAGSTDNVIDTAYSRGTSGTDGTATASFTGNGSGTYGNILNQPNAGGSVSGNGSGTGTALVDAGLFKALGNTFAETEGNADFNSAGFGSGFIDTSAIGGAAGSASGGVAGSAAGEAGGIPTYAGGRIYGDLMASGSSSASADGTFDGGFTPSGSSGTTGGTGSGNGGLNVAGSGSIVTVNGITTRGSTSGSGTATSNAGGAARGFNTLGEAGGLGAGSTAGSASDTTTGTGRESNPSGNTAATGNFESAGSGSFASPGSILAFP